MTTLEEWRIIEGIKEDTTYNSFKTNYSGKDERAIISWAYLIYQVFLHLLSYLVFSLQRS